LFWSWGRVEYLVRDRVGEGETWERGFVVMVLQRRSGLRKCMLAAWELHFCCFFFAFRTPDCLDRQLCHFSIPTLSGALSTKRKALLCASPVVHFLPRLISSACFSPPRGHSPAASSASHLPSYISERGHELCPPNVGSPESRGKASRLAQRTPPACPRVTTRNSAGPKLHFCCRPTVRMCSLGTLNRAIGQRWGDGWLPMAPTLGSWGRQRTPRIRFGDVTEWGGED
jgi:hypothetical protein